MFNGLKSLRKIRYVYITATVVLVVGLGFVLGNLENSGKSEGGSDVAVQPSATAEGSDAQVDQSLGETIGQAEAKKVDKETVIYYEYIYSFCGHIYDEHKQATEDLIGLDEAGLKEKFPDADSISFDDDGVHVKLTINQICPQHVMLKLEDGKCVLYRNVMGTEELKAEQTFTIDQEKWDDGWIESLKSGIVFDSIQELESFIENMES